MMIKRERTNGILARLKQAQDNKDWARMSDILDHASEHDVEDLESIPLQVNMSLMTMFVDKSRAFDTCD